MFFLKLWRRRLQASEAGMSAKENLTKSPAAPKLGLLKEDAHEDAAVVHYRAIFRCHSADQLSASRA
jgi:hypothetical protein